jgi:glycosyltransferase involved in cell wall biosynthesis
VGISAVSLLAPKAVTRPEASARFSILIPTWNNLPYLRLCVESIQRNSAFPHQVVVHVSDGSDGSLDWVRSEGIEHTWSRHNAGVSMALNLAASRARTAFIVYMNDDMYACPGWDVELLRAAEVLGDRPFLLSGTAIEPERYGPHPSRRGLRRLARAVPGGGALALPELRCRLEWCVMAASPRGASSGSGWAVTAWSSGRGAAPTRISP